MKYTLNSNICFKCDAFVFRIAVRLRCADHSSRDSRSSFEQ